MSFNVVAAKISYVPNYAIIIKANIVEKAACLIICDKSITNFSLVLLSPNRTNVLWDILCVWVILEVKLVFLLLSKPLKLLAKLNVTRLGFCPSFRRFCKSLLTFGINSRFLSTRCHFFLISRKTISDSSMLLCYICNPYICNPCLYLLFNASIIFEFINSLHQSKLLFITSFLKGPAKNKTKNLNLTSLRKLCGQNKRVVQ